MGFIKTKLKWILAILLVFIILIVISQKRTQDVLVTNERFRACYTFASKDSSVNKQIGDKIKIEYIYHTTNFINNDTLYSEWHFSLKGSKDSLLYVNATVKQAGQNWVLDSISSCF